MYAPMPTKKGRTWRLARCPLFLVLGAALSNAGCSSPSAPETPTWVDVEPILRGQCVTCHGGNATTAASVQGLAYRLDLFDLTADVCGEAATAVDPSKLFAGAFALGNAQRIADAITIDPANPAPRPLMPPLPAPSLEPWQWETILRWAAESPAPLKGDAPVANRAPIVRISALDTHVDKTLHLSLNLEDPDGSASVGIVKIGSFTLRMERPGAFIADVDTSSWLEGSLPVDVVLCDGWTKANYSIGPVTVAHMPAPDND
jgi:hypothetical protein